MPLAFIIYHERKELVEMNVTLTGTKIKQDTRTLAFEGDCGVEEIVVDVDTDPSWTYKLDVKYATQKGRCASGSDGNVIQLNRNGDTCSVILTHDMLPQDGKYTMQLRGINDDGRVYHSDMFDCWVKQAVLDPCSCSPVPSEFYQIERTITDINNHPPTPGENGYWMIWNPTTRKYEESTVDLPEGTLPEVSDTTKGWYLTNDGERVYWAKVNGGGGGQSDITAIQVNGVDQPIVDTIAQLTITKATVGLNNVDNVRQYSANNPPPYPVTSVDGSTGDVATLSVKYVAQNLTDEQKQRARENIGAGTSNFDGDYNSLTNQPTIPTKTSELENDSGFIGEAGLAEYAKKSDVPTKTSQLTNDSGFVDSTELGDYATKAELPIKVSDLSNDAGYITDAALTPYAKTADVPTKTSELTNDSGFITGNTLDEYAKKSDVPTTVSQLTNDAGYVNQVQAAAAAPVQSVNGKSGAVALNASDVGAVSTADISQTIGQSATKVPSEKAVSDALAAGGHGDMLKSVYDANDAVANAGGIAAYVEANGGKIDTIKVNGTEQAIVDKAVDIAVPTATSDLTNDSGYITAEQAPVQSVNGKTGAIQLTKADIGLSNVDNTSDADKPVSTAQANAIAQVQENLDQLSSNLTDGGVKVKEAETADSVDWSGVKNAPTIPDPYTLPVATADTLGGVKPEVKTDDMLTPVGVDTDGKLWVAATDIDTIPADKVMFTSDLVFTYQFGKYTPTGGKVTVPADNTSLLDVLNDAFSEDKVPTITQPTVSVSSTTAKAYEVGTSVTPQYSATFNAGRYEYGPNPTGAAITAWAASNNITSDTRDTQTGTFPSYIVPDGSAYRITVRGTYSDGQVPITALEKPYPTGQIKGDTKSAQTGLITGYRNSFYGTFADKTTDLSSSSIRGLSQKSGKALTNGSTFIVNVPVGAESVIIAYPSTLRDITYVKDVNGLNADITSAFTTSTVDVQGAGNYAAISYKVYRQDYAKPNDAANTYSVQI